MTFKDPAKRKEYQKAYYEKNRARIIEHNMSYYNAHKETMVAKQKEYYRRIYHPSDGVEKDLKLISPA